ncbi:MAG TPA: caspase family protein [Nitriliruptorales bacterium]
MSPLDPHRALGAAIAVLVVLQAVVVATRLDSAAVPRVAAQPQEVAAPDIVSAGPAAETRESPAAHGYERSAETRGLRAATRAPASRPRSGPAPDVPAQQRFEQRFPGHAAAQQDPRDPATTRWAVLVGINEHQGSVRDNVGSRQDAEELWQHLVELGWRQDQVLLLTDATATYENITEAIAWLGRKTDQRSVAVFHYSGHTKKWYGQDADGDGEITDEGLWPSDNRYIIDSEWVHRMSAVGAGRLWINIGGCESAGLNDPGLERPGRILTFSSTESEKSYEDPAVANSVWGYYLVDQGLRAGHGDLNGDGNVTVEEAFNYAAPRAAQRTHGQHPYGPQHAVVVDHLQGDFDLRIPSPPPPPEPGPAPEEDGGDGDDPGCTLLFCTGTTRER